MKTLLLLILAGIFLIAQTGGKTVPQCQGAGCIDDVTHENHEGAPAWCQNKAMNGYNANCECKRSCDRNDRGSDCVTYCRSRSCRCDHGCKMTE